MVNTAKPTRPVPARSAEDQAELQRHAAALATTSDYKDYLTLARAALEDGGEQAADELRETARLHRDSIATDRPQDADRFEQELGQVLDQNRRERALAQAAEAGTEEPLTVDPDGTATFTNAQAADGTHVGGKTRVGDVLTTEETEAWLKQRPGEDPAEWHARVASFNREAGRDLAQVGIQAVRNDDGTITYDLGDGAVIENLPPDQAALLAKHLTDRPGLQRLLQDIADGTLTQDAIEQRIDALKQGLSNFASEAPLNPSRDYRNVRGIRRELTELQAIQDLLQGTDTPTEALTALAESVLTPEGSALLQYSPLESLAASPEEAQWWRQDVTDPDAIWQTALETGALTEFEAREQSTFESHQDAFNTLRSEDGIRIQRTDGSEVTVDFGDGVTVDGVDSRGMGRLAEEMAEDPALAEEIRDVFSGGLDPEAMEERIAYIDSLPDDADSRRQAYLAGDPILTADLYAERERLSALLSAHEALQNGTDPAEVMDILTGHFAPDPAEDYALAAEIIGGFIPGIQQGLAAKDLAADLEALQTALEEGDLIAATQAGVFSALAALDFVPGIGRLGGVLRSALRRAAATLPDGKAVLNKLRTGTSRQDGSDSPTTTSEIVDDVTDPNDHPTFHNAFPSNEYPTYTPMDPDLAEEATAAMDNLPRDHLMPDGRDVTGEDANQLFLAERREGRARLIESGVELGSEPDHPPFSVDHPVLEGDLQPGTYIRLTQPNANGELHPSGQWLMLKEDYDRLIEQPDGLNQLSDLFALPNPPTHVSVVTIDTPTPAQIGIVGAHPEWGSGGAVQIRLTKTWEDYWFSTPQSIK